MFVDACAIIALLSDEPEAGRVSDALASAQSRITSPVAVLETVLGLARADKVDLAVASVEPLVLDFLDARGIEIRDLPPAPEAVGLSLSAAQRYRSGRHRLNLGDCLHYACAKYYRVKPRLIVPLAGCPSWVGCVPRRCSATRIRNIPPQPCVDPP